ncbi:KINESIN LIGHT CHAIN-RELATED 2-like protein [Drosera capensis]
MATAIRTAAAAVKTLPSSSVKTLLSRSLTATSAAASLLTSPPKPHPETPFHPTPSRNFTTQSTLPTNPALPSRQRKLKHKSNLEDAFEAATELDDMITKFEAMNTCFDERELGLAALKVGLKMDHEGEDPEKIMTYATRALNALDREGTEGISLAMALHLMGSVSYGMKRFGDALGYLNRAVKVLGKEGTEEEEEARRPVMHAVQMELANVKNAMGRREEALVNMKRGLEIKEMILGEDDVEVGKTSRDVAEACVTILDFKEALPHCLKALEIHEKQLGKSSAQVAHDRLLLGVIYTGMEEHEKALEQNRLAQRTLKSWGLSADLLRAEIAAANMEIALGRYEAAVNTLKVVVPQTEKDSEIRAMVFISMAKALVNQDKFGDSRRCLEVASGILVKKEETKPLEVAEAYMDMSMQYEIMNEFTTAISLLKKALALLEKFPQEQHSVGSVSGRIGWLLLLTGKVAEAIPYLESAAETLKESFGPQHFGIGYIYNNLGAAYLELDRPQSAAQMFAVAKDIMDVSLGSHHTDSIEAIQNLSKAYAAMGSYALAIEFQEQAINAWEGHGSTAEDMLKEARRVLEQLKLKVSGSPSDRVRTKPRPLPQTSDPGRSLQPNVQSSSAKPAPVN